jgi:hypothetical protein
MLSADEPEVSSGLADLFQERDPLDFAWATGLDLRWFKTVGFLCYPALAGGWGLAPDGGLADPDDRFANDDGQTPNTKNAGT